MAISHRSTRSFLKTVGTFFPASRSMSTVYMLFCRSSRLHCLAAMSIICRTRGCHNTFWTGQSLSLAARCTYFSAWCRTTYHLSRFAVQLQRCVSGLSSNPWGGLGFQSLRPAFLAGSLKWWHASYYSWVSKILEEDGWWCPCKETGRGEPIKFRIPLMKTNEEAAHTNTSMPGSVGDLPDPADDMSITENDIVEEESA